MIPFVGRWSSRLLKKSSRRESGQNLECADNGGALDFLAFRYLRIQSGVALRLPPHSKYVFQHPARPLYFAPLALVLPLTERTLMSKLRLHYSISIDGYGAGPNQVLPESLGVGGLSFAPSPNLSQRERRLVVLTSAHVVRKQWSAGRGQEYHQPT